MPASEHPTATLSRCALHAEMTLSALTGEAAAQPFPETHTASTMVSLCSLTCLERGCTDLMLEAVGRRLGGYRASGAEG